MISGLQKLTLLDYPGVTACTVFLGGCNFRCPFCHNSQMIEKPEKLIADEEFFTFLGKRRGLLDGVCVTGGEPLLYDKTEDFLKKIKDMGFLVKLDTNGSFPLRLKRAADSGLVDYVAMDIKNSPAKYPLTCGLKEMNFKDIEKSANFLMSSGIDYEFRTTVVKELHEKSDFHSIGKWLCGAKKYFLQPFKDAETVLKKGLSAPLNEDIEEFAGILRSYGIFAKVRGV